MGVLGLSCAIGVCMSYSAFLLRANVSATMFTVVGIMCKIGTVVINQVIWDKHASANGLAALLVCLLAGTFYKQAPLRSELAKAPVSKDTEMFSPSEKERLVNSKV